jgi:hypothetical protein
MDTIPHLKIVPLPSHGIVLCVHHKYCLLPRTVSKHFATMHADHITTAQRTNIQQYIDTLTNQLHQTFSDVQVPSERCPVIDGLTVHLESLKCNNCGHISAGETKVSNIKAHLRKEHNVNSRDIGIRNHAQREAWWSNYWKVITSQRFFTRSICGVSKDDKNLSRHFEVYYPQTTQTAYDPIYPEIPEIPEPTPKANANLTQPNTTKLPSLIQTLGSTIQAQFIEAEREALEDKKKRHATVHSAGDRQTNPYLEHTQFQKCIEGMAWEDVHQYTKPATEPMLKYVEDAVKSMVLVYQHTVAETSRWARIRIMQEHYNHIPLHPLFHYQAYKLHHSSTLVKIFTFFFQIYVKSRPRPPTLCVTSRQDRTWTALQQHLISCNSIYPVVNLKHKRRDLDEFEALCHEFWLSIFEQTSTASDFDFPLVTILGFIAVDPQHDKFRESYNFATDLSAIKKLARFAGCQKLWQQYMQETPSLSLPELNPVQAGDLATQQEEAAALIQEQDEAAEQHDRDNEVQHRALNDAFRNWIYHYLTTEYSTPISWVITTSHYISRFRYGETLDAFVRWNGDTVTVRHISTTFDKYTAMVWQVQYKLEALLLQLTFTEKLVDLPNIPWEELQDDPSNYAPQYSPFSPTQKTLLHGHHFVLKQMTSAAATHQQKNLVIKNLEDYIRVKRYGNLVEELLDTLFLALYFTSGLPGRLTELASIQHENTLSNGIRNLFVFQCHVAAVPCYHKGYNRDKSLKMIYRFPPKQVGSILVWYLWLVRPFITVVTQPQKDGQRTPHYHRARSPLLWSSATGEQYTDSTRFANLLRSTTEQYLGSAMGPALMRHLLTAFTRRTEVDKGQRLQALSAEEVEDIIEQADADSREIQAGHTAATAKMVYALETLQVFRSRFTAPEAHLKASTQWYSRLGFNTATDVDVTDTKRETGLSQLAERMLTRQGNISARQLLRENMGKGSTFRGKQQEVVQHIINMEPVVAYIAGTGSGKSLAFLIPACCPMFGQQIVVTPLVALRIDISKRCVSLSLTHSQFGQPLFDETSRILLASPDDLSKNSFLRLISRRWDLGQLERIVLDEFHYVLLPDHEYRPSLLKMRDVARYGIPITLLSATVPFDREQEAFRLLGLEGQVKTFRQSTSRGNLQYEVVTLRQTSTISHMTSYIRQQQSKHSKILVYVALAKTAESLSQSLACLLYHGKMDEDERTQIQKAFNECSSGILIATIAFVAGVDIPDIGCILWYGAPDHPITFGQGMGRGGRNGLPCVARIVLGPGIVSFFSKLEDAHGRHAMEQIMKRDQCLRIPIDAYFDGEGKRAGCRPKELPCTFCQLASGISHSVFGHTPTQLKPRLLETHLQHETDSDLPIHSSPPARPRTRVPDDTPIHTGSGAWLDGSPTPGT